ncbi:MAG: hypothetical protein IK007_09905 [Lachnospiraceae bacterium]|nr:hypothetical protein [Lachnospiraceae bacterium]
MTNLIKAFLGLLLSVILLTGCSKSDDNANDGGKDNNATVTNAVTQGGQKTGDITPQIGKDVDISNLDEATLKIYPEEKKYSMYFYNAKEISDEVFYKEPEEEIGGDPFIIKGIILEDMDNIDFALDLTEHGQLLKGMDVTSKAFKIQTDKGQVILADVIPYNAQFMREDAGKDVYQFQYYNCVFNNLSLYKTYPEVGDAGKFYGIYLGYDETNACPVFTYGVSNLSRAGFFPSDYVKYHSDETKHYKYRNYIEFDYPVGWSEPFESGGDKALYFGGGLGVLDIQDFEMPDMSLDDAVDMLISQYLGEGFDDYLPEDGDFEDMPDEDMYYDFPEFKLYDHKYITVGKDNDIRAHVFNISQGYSNSRWQDQDIYLLQSKKTLVMIYVLDYTRQSYDKPDAPIPSSEEYAEEMEIHNAEIEKILNSITLCGY